MSAAAESVNDAELHAFVDGALDAAASERVRAWLAEHPDEGQRVESWRRIDDALRAAYGPVAEAPIPVSVLQRAARARSRVPWRLAACAVLVAAGVALGRWGVPHVPGPVAVAERPLAREAIFAHGVYVPEVRHPVEVVAEERDHLQRWLSKRLERPVEAPDLREAGFDLVGGRLLADAGRPAAQFMYEDESGQRLTLYARPVPPTSDPTSFHYGEEGSFGVVYWVDGLLGYALTGPADRGALLELAERVYMQLDR